SSIVRAAELAVPFEAAGPDGLPAGFSVGLTGGGPAPVWVRHSGDGGSVLVQTSTDRTDYRFPLAIYDKATVADVAVSVRFLAESGSVDRAAGIAVRLKDANNYYVIRANALEDNVNFYRMTDGMRREIQGASVKVASGVWHVLGLRAQGDRFTASFDGTVLFAATDRTIAGVGKVALWTKADSVTRFAGLSIETL
ncbi:MAG: hypothetical protein WCI94_08830, partial [Rhodospirillales bacterium]